MMKVALFFDGNNFYTALRDYDSSLDIDYDELAKWLTLSASGGVQGEFVGAYYYTGYSLPSQDVSSPLGAFLDGLELRTGTSSRESHVSVGGRRVPNAGPRMNTALRSGSTPGWSRI